MKDRILRNLNNLNTAIWTLVYAVLLTNSTTMVRIIEPPGRNIIIGGMFVVAVALIFTVLNDNPRFKAFVLAIAGGLWGVLGFLYYLAPVKNHGWVMCFMVVIFIWNSIYRGGLNGYQ